MSITRQKNQQLNDSPTPADHPGRTIAPLDIFVLLNVCLFLLLCVFAYFAQFVDYSRSLLRLLHPREYLIYASGILTIIFLLWWWFRRYRFEVWLLLLLQIGILMHFTGAFVNADGKRIYELYFLGLRYDKYVHFYNAFVVSMLVWKLFHLDRAATTLLSSLSVVLSVLGLGAVVEIVEYGIAKTLAVNGVGDYDNNMQDLIANFIGSSLSTCLLYLRSKRTKSHSSPPSHSA